MSRNYLEAFIVVLVTVALGFFLVWPKSAELKDTRQKIENKKAEIENRTEYYANLEKTVSGFDQNADVIKKIDTAFPNNPDAPSLMNFLQAAAMQSGLIMKSANYSGQVKINGGSIVSLVNNGEGSVASAAPLRRSLQAYSVALVLTGNYANFKSFLSMVENSSRLATVDVVNVATSDGGPSQKNPSEQKNRNQKQDQANVMLDYSVKLSANYYQ
jgi:Tfp pilus assembly protein PilO